MRVVNLETAMLYKPGANLGMFVSGVIIDDSV